MNLESLEILNDKYLNDQLVMFVGSGVSKNSEFPTWDELTCRICQELDMGIKKSSGFSFEEHTTYAQLMYNKDKESYIKILKEIFGVKRDSSKLHKKIIDLGLSDVITTNYDDLLETSDSYNSRSYGVISSDIEMIEQNSKRKLVKMHGSISDFEGIVLKENDYLEFETSRKAIHNYLLNRAFSKTILFVGYSLSDYNVKQILHSINSHSQVIGLEKRTHYLLSDTNGLTEREMKMWNLSKDLLNEMGVKVINVSEFKLAYEEETLHEKGALYYNFLCQMDNFNIGFYDLNDQIQIINRRVDVLNKQNYIYIDEIYHALDISIRDKKYASVLIIDDEKIYDFLIDSIKNDESCISLMFSKSSIQSIVCNNKKYQLSHFRERSLNISKNLLEKRIDRMIYRDALRFDKFSDDEKLDIKRVLIPDFTNNDFSELVDRMNEIIIGNRTPFGENEYSKSEKVFITHKIDSLFSEFDYRKVKQYSLLSSYPKPNTSRLSVSTHKIELEVDRKSGSTVDNSNHFDIANKIVQGDYIYSILNGLASDLWNGDYSVEAFDVMKITLLPFKKDYLNRRENSDGIFAYNKQYKDVVINLEDIMYISEFVDYKKLFAFVKRNKIETINVNFDIQLLEQFLLEYFKNANELFSNQLYQFGFIKSIILFYSLISKCDLDKLINIILNTNEFEKYSEVYSIILEKNIFDVDKMSEDVLNRVLGNFLDCHENVVNIVDIVPVLINNKNKISVENIEKLSIKTKDHFNLKGDLLPWHIVSLDVIDFDQEIIKHAVKDATFSVSTICNLIKFGVIKYNEEVLKVLKKMIVLKEDARGLKVYTGNMINYYEHLTWLFSIVEIDVEYIIDFYSNDFITQSDNKMLHMIVRNDFSKVQYAPKVSERKVILKIISSGYFTTDSLLEFKDTLNESIMSGVYNENTIYLVGYIESILVGKCDG